MRFLRKRHFPIKINISTRFYQILCPQGIKKERRFLRTPPTTFSRHQHDFFAPSGNITRMPFNDNLFYKAPIVLLLKSTFPCVSRPFTRRAPQNKNHFRMTIGLLTHFGVSPATIPIDFSFFLLYLFGL